MGSHSFCEAHGISDRFLLLVSSGAAWATSIYPSYNSGRRLQPLSWKVSIYLTKRDAISRKHSSGAGFATPYRLTWDHVLVWNFTRLSSPNRSLDPQPCWGLGFIGFRVYSRSPKVGNPIASTHKSHLQGVPALFGLNPVSNVLGFMVFPKGLSVNTALET